MTNSNQSMLGAGRIIFPNGMFFGNSTGGNQSSETDVVEVNKNVEPGGGLTVSREVKLLTGDVVVSEIGKGVILKSPDGSCYRVTVQNGGGLVSTAVTCPAN